MTPFDHWSYSKLSTYLRCPRQFRFRYVEEAQLESTSMALLLGASIHGATTLFHARRFQADHADTAELLASFEYQLTQLVVRGERIHYSKSQPDLSSNLELGRRMILAYVEQHDQAKIVALEQELSSPLQRSDETEALVPVHGFIDRVEEAQDDGLVIVEFKTAARAWSQADADLSDQVTCYALLMRAAGYENVRFRFEVLTKTKTPRLQTLETNRSERDIDRLVDQFLDVERAVEAGAFPRNKSPMNCLTCEFRTRCGVFSA